MSSNIENIMAEYSSTASSTTLLTIENLFRRTSLTYVNVRVKGIRVTKDFVNLLLNADNPFHSGSEYRVCGVNDSLNQSNQSKRHR